jgi:hypothetical protein
MQAFTIGGCWLGRELCHAVNEANAFDEFAQSLDDGDPVPALLRFERGLQHHGERTVLGEGALHPLGAVAQGRERGLDRVGGANMQPVLGREIVVIPISE